MTLSHSSDAATDPFRPLQPSREEFALFQRLVHESSGIYLTEAKQPLLAARVARRMRELGLSSFAAYYRAVIDGGEQERMHLLDCVSTNETHFFREPAQFDYLSHTILPSWLRNPQRPREVRAWSTACSTGEEPFTMAMVLHDSLAAAGWTIGITATDISTRVLERARAAEWPLDSAAEIPHRFLRKYMLKGRGTKEGIMRAGPELRALIDFQRMNLNDDSWSVSGPFDLIFCRNVLIYFDAATKRRLIERLLTVLAPGGYLFLGHAESATAWTAQLAAVRPTVYCRRAARE